MPESQMSREEKISQSAQNGGENPPWGDEENFDAERAWSLIKNLRTEKEGLKLRLEEKDEEHRGELDSLKKDLDQRDSAIEEIRSKLGTVEKEYEAREGEVSSLKNDLLSRDSVIRKQSLLSDAGIPLDYVDNVTGADEDAWKESVTRLAALTNASGAQRVPDPVQAARNSGGATAPSKDEEARGFFGV